MISVDVNRGYESHDYPSLMETPSGTIVIMSGKDAEGNGHGMCIESHDVGVSVGEYSRKWNMRNFKELRGSVTISN